MSSNNTEELIVPTEYLEMDPIDLAQDDKGIEAIITYLRGTRENIKAAEKSGKRITAKAARTYSGKLNSWSWTKLYGRK